MGRDNTQNKTKTQNTRHGQNKTYEKRKQT